MKKSHTKLELESLIHLIEGKNTQSFSLSIEEDLTYPVNIAQNHGYSIKESAMMIAEAIGFKGKLTFNTKYQDGAPKKVLEDTRFREFFPDYQFTDHEEGIRKTVAYYKIVL